MTGGPVVVNAGPLIALSAAGCLAVLRDLYGHVLVPDAVFEEVVGAGAGRLGAREVAEQGFLVRTRLQEGPDPLLTAELGAGEAEVITLAKQTAARLVLLDERRARRIAEQVYGLTVRGTAGVLVAAKRAGRLPSVRPLLERMRGVGYYLSSRLVERACREAGE